jgi:hypothetical protein
LSSLHLQPTTFCPGFMHRAFFRIARDDVVFREIDKTGLIAPIIMSHRKGDKSPLLARMKKLIREFDVWLEPAA